MKAQTPALVLPEAIQRYWEAANARRPEAASSHFAPDGVVVDEGETLRGAEAIHAWIQKTTEEYRPMVEPLRMTESDGKHLVAARVSGTFPGSPVELEFVFTLRGGKIGRLEIQ